MSENLNIGPETAHTKMIMKAVMKAIGRPAILVAFSENRLKTPETLLPFFFMVMAVVFVSKGYKQISKNLCPAGICGLFKNSLKYKMRIKHDNTL